MHHLVVAQREHKILAVSVDHRERRLAMVVLPVDRVASEIRQHVVHPPHVPFEVETEPAVGRRPRDAAPRRAFLGNHERPRHLGVHGVVEVAQEIDGLEIFTAAMAVRQPLAGFAGIIEIEHRGHGVHAQAVEVEFPQPVQRGGRQKVAHLVAPEVEDKRAPVRVFALPRVRVFVERGAVEACQRMIVLGKMRRHPIQDHPEAALVGAVDQRPEFVRRAESRRRREITCALVPPGAAERMLGHRQQLKVGETEIDRIIDQRVSQFEVAQRAVAVVVVPRPRAEMNFVDRHRAALGIAFAARFHPGRIIPNVAAGRGGQRGVRRRVLAEKGKGIALEPQRAVRVLKLKFVMLPGADPGDKARPQPGAGVPMQRVGPSIEPVPVADHTDPPGIRCPHREAVAVGPIHAVRVRAKHVVEVAVGALGDVIAVQIGHGDGGRHKSFLAHRVRNAPT